MLKPSEALRRGRQMVPRFIQGLFTFDYRKDGEAKEVYAACALGAMAVGYYGDNIKMIASLDGESYFWPAKFDKPFVEYPCKHDDEGYDTTKPIGDGDTVDIVIAHLNDVHAPLVATEKVSTQNDPKGLISLTKSPQKDIWTEARIISEVLEPLGL